MRSVFLDGLSEWKISINHEIQKIKKVLDHNKPNEEEKEILEKKIDVKTELKGCVNIQIQKEVKRLEGELKGKDNTKSEVI